MCCSLTSTSRVPYWQKLHNFVQASLVRLVHMVDLVCLVHRISFVQPNKQDKPNNSLLPSIVFLHSLLQYENEYADIHVATGIDLLTKFYL